MATDPNIAALRLRADARIYLAGHTGLVWGAILRVLQERSYASLDLRRHAIVDLTCDPMGSDAGECWGAGASGFSWISMPR